MDSLEDLLITRSPTAERPLLGLTVLAVEDSRFACEALRLMCQKSGARIRRADTLRHARRHMRTYRPDVLIVDLGLPDGHGADLISDIAAQAVRPEVILGTSGDPDGARQALGAGADGFLEKPVTTLGEFQSTILSHLPWERQPRGPRSIDGDVIEPDELALKDDLAHAAAILSDFGDEEIDYVTQFLGGIARTTADTGLGIVVDAIAVRRAENLSANAEISALRAALEVRLSNSHLI